MGSSKSQGDLWGREAKDWAELQEVMHKPLWEAMIDAGNVGEGSRVCDLGCGGGGASIVAAERGAKVSGLDAAAALVDIARGHIPGGDFRVGDMEDLPFPDRSFDAVLVCNSIQYTEDRLSTLLESRRVCDSEGRVVVGLWGTPDKVEMRHCFKAFRDALPEPPPGKGPFELSQPGVLTGLIKEAGMTLLDVGEAECPFSYPSFEAFWRGNVSSGAVQAALGQISEDELLKSVRSALQPIQSADGSMTFQNTFQFVVAAP